MSRRQIIALDIDGCFADWDGPYRALLNNAGATIPDGESLVWDYLKTQSTPDQWAVAQHRVTTSPDWWKTLPVHKDVVAARQRIMTLLDRLDVEHTLIWVTARPHGEGVWEQTADWLETRLKLWRPRVVVAPHMKPQIYAALGAQYVVEDCLEHAEGLAQSAAEPRIFLVDRLWNRAPQMPGVQRCASTVIALERIASEVGL